MHRDIKPANILLRSRDGQTNHRLSANANVQNYEVKLADFGLSRTLGPESMATVGVGTPGYIAPEVLNGDVYTMSCDNYSLAITIAQLFFGEQLPRSRSQIGILSPH